MSHKVASCRRRGMLLLMVMLMLALFMAIGAMLLTISARARAAARAGFVATQQSGSSDVICRNALDEALMAALRGTRSGTNASIAVSSTTNPNLADNTEPILADKYGQPVLGSGTLLTGLGAPPNTGVDKPILALALTLQPGSTNFLSRLNGRVLTIKPAVNDGDIASYRVIGSSVTSGSTAECYLDHSRKPAYRKYPTTQFDVIINGREFPHAITATGSATINSGTVTSVVVTGSGWGYSQLYPPVVVISPPPIATGTTATAVAVVNSSGQVTGINVTNAGSGYRNPPADPPPAVTIGPPQGEAYDAFDDENRWLAQPLLTNGQVARFDRLSFTGTSSTPVVDNDNDGILDGVWIPTDSDIASAIASSTPTPPPFIIPDRPSPLGGTLRFQASYLILDLDGRININAAGMARPESGAYGSMEVPLGMGYGPADIDASLLFPATAPSLSGTSDFINTGTSGTTTWASIVYGGTSTSTSALPTAVQRRAPPLLGLMDGKYGSNDRPGIAGDDSGLYQLTLSSTSGTSANYSTLIAGTNAWADLQGRKKIFMSGTSGQITPVMNIFSVTPIASATSAATFDATDDPYELRLDAEAPRPAVTSQTGAAAIAAGLNDDNPYTPPELERILRASDSDAPQLPQRLAAGLRDFSQRSRMMITTDSWDTPAITGLARLRIEEQLANASAIKPLEYSSSAWSRSGGINAASPDVAAGLRFNINRSIISDGNPDSDSPDEQADKQNYCKGLYTLVTVLGASNSISAAQWAANVMDFRDSDNVPTRFEYDTNLMDGWNPSGGTQVVWGVERPEVVITEVAARRDNSTPPGTSEVYVVLHRVPYNTLPSLWSSANTLLNDPNNSYRIQLTSPSGTANYPLTGTLTATGPTSYLCVFTATPLLPANFSVANTGTLPIPNFSFPRDPAGIIAATGTISLQRIVNSGTVTVDTAVIPNILEITSNPSPAKLRRRGPADIDIGPPNTPTQSDWMTAFWKQVFITESGSNPRIIGPYVTGTAYTSDPSKSTTQFPVSWFHWPNRPFISQAELFLVPTGTSSGADAASRMLANYSFPYLQESGSTTLPRPFHSLASSTNSITIGGTSAPLGSLILEATYAPSRFAGNTLTVSGSSVEILGLNTLLISGSTISTRGSLGELSKWREPGKVNVNTIVPSTTVRSSTTPLPDEVVWTTLLGTLCAPNPFAPLPEITSTIPAVPAIPRSRGNPTIPAIPAIPKQPIQPSKKADSLAKTLFLLTGTNAEQLLSGTSAETTPLADYTTPPNEDLYPRDRNPFFAYAQAIRLANTATIRSQVFAVWITVKITDDSPNAPSPVTKRMFAIIDRSIPVGYAPGQDLNVRDTIRLKRYLD
jgi:hypothetical protein